MDIVGGGQLVADFDCLKQNKITNASNGTMAKERKMGTIWFWVLVVLGPSMAAAAWFICYADAPEILGHDQHEPRVGS
jgi:hypothetical protein